MSITPPPRRRPDAVVSRRFSRQAREGTAPEVRIRQHLHARGLRFRIQHRISGLPRRRVDLAFTRVKLAVLVDGCFWHSCPVHGTTPKSNRDWWLWKLSINEQRDRDTDRRLADLGWTVLRLWEHVPPSDAADLIEETYRGLLRRQKH
ncbi:DNA mismatch endonuclease Vsr [Janibacter cremeus]|uniref:very short patch repair endonuclease n=1 Tax=Janibacter cremeus TaxID=1285192 RepID=UPI0023F93D36|nr:DNA mismatch endonuclease Vsr [Janibacter cremeus]WEV78609.1 DNA mismatch endonuclease Vsr [Janibacter cremeus]